MKKKILIAAAVLVLIITAGLIFMSSQNSGKNRYALIQTNKGDIKFELFEDKAPVTSKNFIKLAQSGFYNGLKFHRYEPGFVIQGGDPNGDGSGGSKETIPLEIVPELKHDVGAVGMARANDPNSASSQFYIVVGEAHFLDGSYAVFGKVAEGMNVALSLRAGDVMRKVEIVG
ncbi:peptidylprolyl isomerase [archaeon]|nr:MAG: peptidylprolyl isomerase [archaeon]